MGRGQINQVISVINAIAMMTADVFGNGILCGEVVGEDGADDGAGVSWGGRVGIGVDERVDDVGGVGDAVLIEADSICPTGSFVNSHGLGSKSISQANSSIFFGSVKSVDCRRKFDSGLSLLVGNLPIVRNHPP